MQASPLEGESNAAKCSQAAPTPEDESERIEINEIELLRRRTAELLVVHVERRGRLEHKRSDARTGSPHGKPTREAHAGSPLGSPSSAHTSDSVVLHAGFSAGRRVEGREVLAGRGDEGLKRNL